MEVMYKAKLKTKVICHENKLTKRIFCLVFAFCQYAVFKKQIDLNLTEVLPTGVRQLTNIKEREQALKLAGFLI